MNRQTKHWLGEGGRAWTDRNKPDSDTIKGRAETFKKLMGSLPVHTILEVGCNSGYNLTAISTIGDYELTGIDISSYAIENTECTENLIVADGLRLPFEDNSFDLVVACNYLDGFSPRQLPKIIKETSRVVNKYILVIDYSTYELAVGVEMYHKYTTGDVYYMRNYLEKFPNFLCVGYEGPRQKLDGFSENILSWWLFESMSELSKAEVKIKITRLARDSGLSVVRSIEIVK